MIASMPRDPAFRLIVITTPTFFPGEAACLEGLLEAGLQTLHLRKPGSTEEAMKDLLRQLSPRWYSRLVLHGSRDLAESFGIPQIHSPVKKSENEVKSEDEGKRVDEGKRKDEGKRGDEGKREVEEKGGEWENEGDEKNGGVAEKKRLVVSLSLHSWKEYEQIEKMSGDPGEELDYVLMSPLFDSISKPGYMATAGLLQNLPARYSRTVNVIGLGGIDPDTILPVIRHGWDGAAVLGWIWEEPAAAVKRFEQLKHIIETHADETSDHRHEV